MAARRPSQNPSDGQASRRGHRFSAPSRHATGTSSPSTGAQDVAHAAPRRFDGQAVTAARAARAGQSPARHRAGTICSRYLMVSSWRAAISFSGTVRPAPAPRCPASRAGRSVLCRYLHNAFLLSFLCAAMGPRGYVLGTRTVPGGVSRGAHGYVLGRVQPRRVSRGAYGYVLGTRTAPAGCLAGRVVTSWGRVQSPAVSRGAHGYVLGTRTAPAGCLAGARGCVLGHAYSPQRGIPLERVPSRTPSFYS